VAATAAVTLAPIPSIEVRVIGDAAAARHLAAEWAAATGPGAAAAATPAPGASGGRLDVEFVHRLPGAATDGHKSVRWSAMLEQAGERELRLRIALGGWPRWFGLSLVQGYLIEPALSLLAPGAGSVLLPAAAIVRDGQAVILLGRSGTGKSSLSLRALAAGLPVLGDDQVLVSADGQVHRFPRRLRLYSDAGRTAPGAMAGLPRRHRAALTARRLVRVATRGYIAPSLAVPATARESSPAPSSVVIGSVVLLERAAGTERVSSAPARVDLAVARAADVLAAQRRRLVNVLEPAWTARIDEVEARERDLLTAAMAAAEIMSVSIPDARGPGGAEAVIIALAAAVGLP
jgi:hypothetical protein